MLVFRRNHVVVNTLLRLKRTFGLSSLQLYIRVLVFLVTMTIGFSVMFHFERDNYSFDNTSLRTLTKLDSNNTVSYHQLGSLFESRKGKVRSGKHGYVKFISSMENGMPSVQERIAERRQRSYDKRFRRPKSKLQNNKVNQTYLAWQQNNVGGNSDLIRQNNQVSKKKDLTDQQNQASENVILTGQQNPANEGVLLTDERNQMNKNVLFTNQRNQMNKNVFLTDQRNQVNENVLLTDQGNQVNENVLLTKEGKKASVNAFVDVQQKEANVNTVISGQQNQVMEDMRLDKEDLSEMHPKQLARFYAAKRRLELRRLQKEGSHASDDKRKDPNRLPVVEKVLSEKEKRLLEESQFTKAEDFLHTYLNNKTFHEDFNQAFGDRFANDDIAQRALSQSVLEFKNQFKTNVGDVNETNPLSNERYENEIEHSRVRKTRAKKPTAKRCLIEGIYWTPFMKEFLPKGIEPGQADVLLQVLHRHQVASLRGPKWNQCGRPKNAVAVFEDGPLVCARYRAPHDRMVLGEVLSYWLARALGLKNVPPVALSQVNSTQWQGVEPTVHQLGWQENEYTALILWISDISQTSKVYMPEPILNAIRTGQPWMPPAPKRQRGGKACRLAQDVTSSQGQLCLHNLTQLVQWGNMIVFDYITGNYDRVASMLDAADKEQKPGILMDRIRNLPMSRSTGALWLIDNESGLLDAYDLLYRDVQNGHRFQKFHRTLLQTLCVFDKGLIHNVITLFNQSDPYVFLWTYAKSNDRLAKKIPTDYSFKLFQRHFFSRLKDVLNWVSHCQLLYNHHLIV